MDYLKYYNLEGYLFDDVNKRFHEDGSLAAFDFFCIVIWKANRAKTKVASRLLARRSESKPGLEAAVARLTESLFLTQAPEERLRILLEDWGFLLPMASAILAVLYPDDFTVYDVRVCNELGNFHNLANKTAFDSIWKGYREYLAAVEAAAPRNLNLRDKDRFLWAKSFAEQLEADVGSQFSAGV